MYLIYGKRGEINVVIVHDEKYDGPIENYINSSYYKVEKSRKND
jgi:hypothetical protein